MMNKRGDGIIDEHIGWILAAVLLILLLIGLFFIGNPLLRWIGYLPDYNYNQGDKYIGDVAPDVKLPDGQVRYCPAKIGDISGGKYNPFSNPVQYISFWSSNSKDHDIKTSFYLQGNSEEGIIYLKEAGDMPIADISNGYVVLKREILDGSSKERYLIWFNYLSNKPRPFRLEFMSRLVSLDKSIIYSGNYVCHPDDWKIPEFSDLWPPSDSVLFINNIRQSGKIYSIDLNPYLDHKKAGFNYLYVQRLGSFNNGQTFINQRYLTIYGKKLGYFGIDVFAKDISVGIIFRDGSVLISKEYYSMMKPFATFENTPSGTRVNTDNILVSTDPFINLDENLIKNNYRTNIFISEDKSDKLFSDVE